ncbi:MAG: Nif3-like dinuclear metal center hexameric protein [Thermonemataceae bacterium]|nr:Nif3-like dinuclear metal center hexameric protein [Thermonemataceae bacterium]
MNIQSILDFLENIAPSAYQESYDNAGLVVGDAKSALSNVLITLDITEEVIEEAISRNCNLIIAHHPILFKAIKSLKGNNYVERVLLKAIKNDIALYAAHTNLDNVWGGVNFKIAEILALQNPQILVPKKQILSKLTTFCPASYQETILEALWKAGAGNIGNYEQCSFVVEGIGTYRPNEKAQPFIGEHHKLERAQELRLEVIFPTFLQNKILMALRETHPYEEIAYYLHNLENTHQEVGAGLLAELPQAMPERDFLAYLKEKMQLSHIKHTKLLNKPIQKIAICGGSGFFLLKNAIQAKADIFITADIKYHEFFDAENKIILADIGHYESEIFTKDLLFEVLSKKFPNIAFLITNTNTNPVYYF